MPELVFFYGTRMRPFKRPGRQRIDRHLAFVGRGAITAALFDLGLYPAAVPATDAEVHGEVFEMLAPEAVLVVLDEIEGYRPDEPESSLYVRVKAPVTLPDGTRAEAWVYFYNAPLGGAQRIESGDYLEYLKVGTTAEEGATRRGGQP